MSASSGGGGGGTASVISTCAPSRARRNLFGRPDRAELDASLAADVHTIMDAKRRRWGFDFELDRPVSDDEPGDHPHDTNQEQLDVQAVPANEVPSFYRPSVLKRRGGTEPKESIDPDVASSSSSALSPIPPTIVIPLSGRPLEAPASTGSSPSGVAPEQHVEDHHAKSAKHRATVTPRKRVATPRTMESAEAYSGPMTRGRLQQTKQVTPKSSLEQKPLTTERVPRTKIVKSQKETQKITDYLPVRKRRHPETSKP